MRCRWTRASWRTRTYGLVFSELTWDFWWTRPWMGHYGKELKLSRPGMCRDILNSQSLSEALSGINWGSLKNLSWGAALSGLKLGFLKNYSRASVRLYLEWTRVSWRIRGSVGHYWGFLTNQSLSERLPGTGWSFLKDQTFRERTGISWRIRTSVKPYLEWTGASKKARA